MGGSESDSGDDGQTNGFFIEEGKKSVKLKSNTKIEQAKRKVKQDNRQGQRERKKHAKAVYGKHVQVVEKQEKKFRERNKKRKEKPGQKTTGNKKIEEEEIHPSWAASKKAKIERSKV